MSDAENLREELIEIIAKEGMIDREKLTPDATLETIGMASYDMVMVLMALEEKFGVYISVDSELTEVKTLDELLTVLVKRIEDQKNAPPGEAPTGSGASAAMADAAAAMRPPAAAAAAGATASTAALAAAMAAESEDTDDGPDGDEPAKSGQPSETGA